MSQILNKMGLRGGAWLRLVMLAGVTGMAFAAGASSAAGTSPVPLPAVTVYSPRVANQSSAVSFAMPVSVLRFEPRVDIQSRNLAEGQADLTIRGGTFENIGVQLGALTVGDPQTGHYLLELPVAPAMLGVPRVVTGADLPLGPRNATAGALAYGWRPVERVGALGLAWGENNLRRAEVYQATRLQPAGSRGSWGLDVAVAHSESDGAVLYGDHEFDRANLRLQYAAPGVQTDAFVGYQSKRFGWPNLYTPFGSNETENLQTRLVIVNHRVQGSSDGFLEFGVFDRRNKDDYAFNRFAPLGPVHPFQHTSWLRGGAFHLQRAAGDLTIEVRAEVQADQIRSTSLMAGRYQSRTMTKGVVLARRKWSVADGGSWGLRVGGSHDDTNRDAGSLSPALEWERTLPTAPISRVYVGVSRATQVPTYTALNSSSTSGLFRGNPNLGRSASDNLEIGCNGKAGGWTFESAAFYRRDRRLVDWTFRTGVVARTANAVDVDVAGLELVMRRAWQSCEVTLGYTFLDKQEDYRGAQVDASFYALNYARQRLTAAIVVRPVRGIEVRIDNALRVQADNLLRVVGGREALHTTMGVAWRPTFLPRSEVSLAVDNLWNESFQEIPAVPATPRQASLAWGITW